MLFVMPPVNNINHPVQLLPAVFSKRKVELLCLMILFNNYQTTLFLLLFKEKTAHPLLYQACQKLAYQVQLVQWCTEKAR